MYDFKISIDIETACFRTNSPILQIGAIKQNKDKSVDKLNVIIKHEPSVNKARLINNISETSAINGTEKTEAFDMLYEFIGKGESKALFVGHNLQTFDAPRLNLELSKYRFMINNWNIYDTMRVIQNEFKLGNIKHWRNLPIQKVAQKTNLLSTAKHYNLKVTEMSLHNALYDASVTYEIFQSQIIKHKWQL